MTQADKSNTPAQVSLSTGLSPEFSAFMRQVLAPLPKGERKVDSPTWRRDLENDRFAGWNHYMGALELVELEMRLLNKRATVLGHEAVDQHRWHQLAAERYGLIRSQCLMPAPSVRELKWKLKHEKLACSAGKRQIAADRAALLEQVA